MRRKNGDDLLRIQVTQESSESRIIQTPEPGTSRMLTLPEMCGLLSVSAATGKNWLRLGTLKAQAGTQNHPLFCPEYAEQMRKMLKSDSNTRLKSRRNKQMQSGFSFFHSYTSEGADAERCVGEILAALKNRSILPEEDMIRMIEAEYALRLTEDAARRSHPEEKSYLRAWKEGRIRPGTIEALIEDILGENEPEVITAELPQLFSIPCRWERGEDLLGLILISLRNSGKRKTEGTYYTPVSVVQTLCRETFEESHGERREKELSGEQECLPEKAEQTASVTEKKNRDIHGTIWDPACGTGSFLLHLPENVTLDQVYGSDIDLLSIQIARVNLALHYRETDCRKLYRHLVCEDTLNPENEDKRDCPDCYDFIIGNPPWGVHYTAAQRKILRKRYRSASGWGTESCDLFLERSLQRLRTGGTLAFVLPEAVLHVKSHREIRRILTETCRFSYLNYLGDVFDGVQCPAIVLKTEKVAEEGAWGANEAYPGIRCSGMWVEREDTGYELRGSRRTDPLGFSFHVTDEDQKILNHMDERDSITYLAGQADFALGIVTGDNSRWISERKTEKNEIILRGTDIDRYHYRIPERYIEFCPENFQQTAPEEMYRAPEKLFYRFISNQLVFAWDNRRTLSLNSCNILIPKIPGMDMRCVMAVLNSRPVQFYYRNRFRSVKVLRSCLEAIPIPVIPAEQQAEILAWTEEMMHLSEYRAEEALCSTESAGGNSLILQEKAYNCMDRLIAECYGLTGKEYQRILEFTSAYKLML